MEITSLVNNIDLSGTNRGNERVVAMRAAWQRIKVQGIVCLHYNPKGCKICVPESVLNGEVDQTASAKKARTAKGNLKLLQFWLKADEVKYLVFSVSGNYHNGAIVGIVEQDRKKKLAKDLYFVFVVVLSAKKRLRKQDIL